MTYEVELKFPLEEEASLLAQLEALGAVRGAALEQRDLYFAHPDRDFAQTDEAFRMRCTGESNRLTYKGPIVDAQTKMRHEIEIGLDDGASTADSLQQMLELLGFRAVRTVVKTRVPFSLEWEQRSLEVALDTVPGLGTFLEIELLAEEDEREAARETVLRLAEHLGLTNDERRSYLCLLLEQDRSGAT